MSLRFSVSLTIDTHSMGEGVAKNKAFLVNDLFNQVNELTMNRNYGGGIKQYLISLYITNPPSGYGHLLKDLKPKYTEHKVLINSLTHQKTVIEREFHYSIRMDTESYVKFVAADDHGSKKMVALEIIKSFSLLDQLPKRVLDFNKELFISDLTIFFSESGLI